LSDFSTAVFLASDKGIIKKGFFQTLMSRNIFKKIGDKADKKEAIIVHDIEKSSTSALI